MRNQIAEHYNDEPNPAQVAEPAGPHRRTSDDHLHLDYRPAASLIPYARNARTHSDSQVAQIAASIREFGFTTPLLVDGENGIIAGYGRLMAARKLGMDTVIELAGLSGAQKKT